SMMKSTPNGCGVSARVARIKSRSTRGGAGPGASSPNPPAFDPAPASGGRPSKPMPPSPAGFRIPDPRAIRGPTRGESKPQFPRILHLPLRVNHSRDDARLLVPDIDVRQPEIRMIHQVERFAAELQPEPLGEPELAAHAQVQINKPGRPENTASR